MQNIKMPNFKQANVLVVGDIMLDKYWFGAVNRISPESPVPILLVESEQNKPGGASNVALNIASLGVKTSIIGIVGKDEAAILLKNSLESCDISSKLIAYDDYKTIVKLRMISKNQQLLRTDFEYQIPQDFSYKHFLEEQLNDVKVVVFSDYGKGSLYDIDELVEIVNKRNIKIFIDPKGNNFDKYKNAFMLTPNQKEFEAIVGLCKTEQELISKARALILKLNLQALLITQSEKGMTLVTAKDSFHLAAKAREVFDVTGAGDTVIATCAAAIAAGSTLEEAVRLSNISAALVVAKMGTAVVSESELALELASIKTDNKGILSQSQLLEEVQKAKKSGEKIVFTNGCFDILHAGHVTYLQEAKKQGDKLIVAVNEDESVKRLKGAGRPINNCKRRQVVLSELSSVDWVTSFSEDDPMNLIETLRPDVLVKGGDYKIEQIIGHELVESYGGKVKVLSLVPDISTTKIVSIINDNAKT